MVESDEHQIFSEIVAIYDAPAYVRRARQVEDSWSALVAGCRKERERLLEMPRLRLARFIVLVEPWRRDPDAVLPPDEFAELLRLDQEWQVRLRHPVKPARSALEARHALLLLAESFARFNERWAEYVERVDFGPINLVRERYNQFYLIEKECAVCSVKTAQKGFVRLAPLSSADLYRELPLLKIPAH